MVKSCVQKRKNRENFFFFTQLLKVKVKIFQKLDLMRVTPRKDLFDFVFHLGSRFVIYASFPDVRVGILEELSCVVNPRNNFPRIIFFGSICRHSTRHIRPGTYDQYSARHRHNYCKYGERRRNSITGYGGGYKFQEQLPAFTSRRYSRLGRVCLLFLVRMRWVDHIQAK